MATKPYKVISISMYEEDLDALDKRIWRLKRKGYHKMSRSELIRRALDVLDDEKHLPDNPWRYKKR
jgi:metal-responsive CopG/Arc/MetJ family transcriptional regulator